MIIIKALLLADLEKRGLSIAELAQKMGVSVLEVEKLLGGTAVGVETARKFIAFFGSSEAAQLIDWVAIGKKNPFADEQNKD